MAMRQVGDNWQQALKVCRHHFSIGIQAPLFLRVSEGRQGPMDVLCGSCCSREQLLSVTTLRLFSPKLGVLR